MAKEIKKPLPVRLTEEQHKFLEAQNVGKAEYIRNLIVIDMNKRKRVKK
jgi:hypothetical protein